jgi:U8 snoRNA-decapping enzyme
MRNNWGGLPSFLRNNFIGNAREQLLLGLKHEGLLSEKEINEAVLQYRMLENEVNPDQ